MGRYLRSLRRFWGTAAAGQMEYQLNLLIELVAMAGNLAGSLFVLSLFFRQGEGLGGWSWPAAQVVLGAYTVLDGLTSTLLRPNLSRIVTHVQEGTLDFVLLKPIDSQFWLSLRTVSPAGLPELVVGAGADALGVSPGRSSAASSLSAAGGGAAGLVGRDPLRAVVRAGGHLDLVRQNLECHRGAAGRPHCRALSPPQGCPPSLQ